MREQVSRLLLVIALIVIVVGQAFAVDVKLVLDRSSSMAGERIEAARQGAKLFCRMLTSSDSVQIIGFSDRAEASRVFQLSVASDREAMLQHLNGLKANGGTNYLSGLNAVSANGSNGPQTVIFLSDGEHQEILVR